MISSAIDGMGVANGLCDMGPGTTARVENNGSSHAADRSTSSGRRAIVDEGPSAGEG